MFERRIVVPDRKYPMLKRGVKRRTRCRWQRRTDRRESRRERTIGSAWPRWSTYLSGESVEESKPKVAEGEREVLVEEIPKEFRYA